MYTFKFISILRYCSEYKLLKKYNIPGQHNDARMNVAIILSAIRHGAKAVNHVKVDKLLKDSTGRVCGAHVVDTVSFVSIDLYMSS